MEERDGTAAMCESFMSGRVLKAKSAMCKVKFGCCHLSCFLSLLLLLLLPRLLELAAAAAAAASAVLSHVESVVCGDVACGRQGVMAVATHWRLLLLLSPLASRTAACVIADRR